MEFQQIMFAIDADRNDPVLLFGSSELVRFLSAAGHQPVEGSLAGHSGMWLFKLQPDSRYTDKTFHVSCHREDPAGPVKVLLAGEDASCVLSALYTFLEKAGFLFEITGPVQPEELRLEDTLNWSETIRPSVAFRGIRQHINFPMDISSYTLEDAKEYVRNVARMRFNQLSFHSYYRQWHRATLPDKQLRAGWFFYGQVHTIPDHPLLKAHLQNDDIFCIPEAEPRFHDPDARSEAAIHWLQGVFREVKRCGLTLQLSIEGWDQEHNCHETHDNMVEICKALLTDYPDIDRLELMTGECGGYAGSTSRENTLDTLIGLYGEEFVAENRFADMLGDPTMEIAQIAPDAFENLKVLQTLSELWKDRKKPALSLGVYSTDIPTLRIMLKIMRSTVPETIDFSFLPAHGARHVFESVSEMGLEKEDVARTMFYSWSEFDGNMYLSQNAVNGNHDLLSHLQAIAGGQLKGFAVNHWRTAENKASLRYAAEAALKGSLSPEEFYRAYAAVYGIQPFRDFTYAMQLLDLSEIHVRRLPNAAFSFVGCWVLHGKLGYISTWDKNDIPRITADYSAILDGLRLCLPETALPAGREYLEFLINRVECSVIYFRIISTLIDVKDIAGSRTMEELNETEREGMRRICDAALPIAEEYMEHLVRYMPDRGCQGTLISFYHTLPPYIRRIRIMYGEGRDSSLCTFNSPDAPPSPE